MGLLYHFYKSIKELVSRRKMDSLCLSVARVLLYVRKFYMWYYYFRCICLSLGGGGDLRAIRPIVIKLDIGGFFVIISKHVGTFH